MKPLVPGDPYVEWALFWSLLDRRYGSKADSAISLKLVTRTTPNKGVEDGVALAISTDLTVNVAGDLEVAGDIVFDDGTTLASAAAVGAFDLHDDVTTQLTAITTADRFVVSDESATGDPNRYVTYGTLVTRFNADLAFDFDLHDDVGTQLSTLAGADRFVVSDESVSGDPNRYITATNVRNYMEFDLHDDVTTQTTTLADNDRFVISDESVGGDPNRYVTATNLATYTRPTRVATAEKAAGTATGVRSFSPDDVADMVDQHARLETLTDQASIAWDVRARPVAEVTLAGNRTLANPTNPATGGVYVIEVKQDATGSRALQFGTAYNFGEEGTPSLTTTAGASDIMSFLYNDSQMKMIGLIKGF